MFGPNKYFRNYVKINYSHRDKEFFRIYRDTINLFKEKFNLKDYDILLIPGSATLGIEALMYSLTVPLKITGIKGSFTNRWKIINDRYESFKEQGLKPVNLYFLYETSKSEYYSELEPGFIDATSGFPFYDIPENSLGFVTCLNKQLSSYCGVAVIGIRKNCWHMFKLDNDDNLSYLNLRRYYEYSKINQTPSTFPTHILKHFYGVLKKYNVEKLREDILKKWECFDKYLPRKMIIGTPNSPVITFKNKAIPDYICKKYELYGYSANREHIQLFLYNGTLHQFKKLFKKIKDSILF